MFHLPAPVNCWLWVEEDGLTLIDAAQPWNTNLILHAVSSLSRPLTRIILTHAHPDHAGAAAELQQLTGAAVFAHQLEADFLRGRACMADLDGARGCRLLLGLGRTLGWLSPPVVDAVHELTDEQVVGSLRILHTPGHTPGSISVWSEEEKALFCGDNVSSVGNVLRLNNTIFTLDFKSLKSGLDIYKGVQPRLLLPGHGPAYGKPTCASELHALL